MKEATSPSRAARTPQGLLSQQDFDKLIERYNVDYQFLLLRASAGQYNCLITSFIVLQDLYIAIIKLHDVSRYDLRVVPRPITLRSNDALLDELGLDDDEKGRVKHFLKFVRETQGKEFEQILDEGALVQCQKISDELRPTT
jgi:hypothetical protein